eukprot:5576885-Amphidinium_carterae.1
MICVLPLCPFSLVLEKGFERRVLVTKFVALMWALPGASKPTETPNEKKSKDGQIMGSTWRIVPRIILVKGAKP